MILKSRFRLDGGLLLVPSVLESAALLIPGIIDELSKDDRPRRRQWPPRPPEVQRRWMPMSMDFSLAAGDVDGIERKSHLNELAGRFDGIVHSSELFLFRTALSDRS